MVNLKADPRGVLVPVRAHAGAQRNGISGTHDGMLRVAVTAAPEKGKANKAIITVLSKAFGLPKSSIELVAGETSPHKRFLIVGGDVGKLRETIARLVGG